MTEVCILGKDDADLRFDLLSYETARRALSAYDLREPFENAVAVETISLGVAVSLLGDLDWYLVRLADEALVREPSVSETEWLSRDLARAVRDGRVEPEETGDLLKVYGVEYDGDAPTRNDEDDALRDDEGDAFRDDGVGADGRGDETGGDTDEAGESVAGDEPDGRRRRAGRLVEPMFVRRLDGHVPEYDLRDVAETVVVRVTEDEFQ